MRDRRGEERHEQHESLATTLARYAAQIVEKDERIAELEHWFHGYKTPEESMSAMLQRIEELNALLDEIAESLQHDAQPTAIRILGILNKREQT